MTNNKHSFALQHGGVKVTRDENGKTVPTCDQKYIVHEVFRRVEMLNLFAFGSSCSLVFKGSLSNVMLRSQRGLSQTNARDCLENVRMGDPVFDVVFKISIVDDNVDPRDPHKRWHYLDPFNEKTKVTITHQEADREVYNQVTLHERLSCVNTDGAFIPDVVGHHMMELGEFTGVFESLTRESRLSAEANQAFEWISKQVNGRERKIDVIIMEFAEGEPVASLSWIDSRHGSLGTAACAVVAAIKGDGFVPSDLHQSNTVMVPASAGSADQIPTVIDFGRWWIISMDEHELMRTFETLLEHNLDVPKSSPITIAQLCHFFKCHEANLKKAFQDELDYLKTDNDACCLKLQGPDAFKNIHRTLMMIAFIDFMINRCKNDHATCQFAHGMEHVYVYEDHQSWVQHAYGGNTFKHFPKFLERCTPDYDTFFSETLSKPDCESDKAIVLGNLQRVHQLIKHMIAKCPYGSDPSVTCAGLFRFKPPPMEAMEVDADPIQAMAFVPPRRSAKSQPPKSQPPKSQLPKKHFGVAKSSIPPVIPVPKSQSDTKKTAPIASVVCEKKKDKGWGCALMGGTLKRSTLKRGTLKRINIMVKRSTLKCRTHKKKHHKRNRK